MKEKKEKLIEKLLKTNIDFVTNNIPIIFDEIKKIKRMDSSEFDENPELGEEAKEQLLLSLQYQMGYLAGMQSENMKFTNILLHMNSEDAINQLEKLIESSNESNEKMGKDIKNNIL